MASEFSIRAVNDWRAAVHTDLSTALRVSRDVFGRNAAQATKHMIIVMAQSARALTKEAAKTRPVIHDEYNRPFVWILHQSGDAGKLYKWQAEQRGADGWERAQRIGNRGLAKRSWMWGLSQIKGDVAGYTGRGAAGKPIPGVARSYEVRSGRDTVGYVMENRLGYLERILPAGWLATVEQKAVNLVMKRAEMKMVQEFAREIGKRAVFTQDGKPVPSSAAARPAPASLAEAARTASTWNEYQSITAGRFGADRRQAAAAWREAKGK